VSTVSIRTTWADGEISASLEWNKNPANDARTQQQKQGHGPKLTRFENRGCGQRNEMS
jgi:hypothetical protein